MAASPGQHIPERLFPPPPLTRLSGSRAAKVLGGLAALLVLAGLIAGLALLPADNARAQSDRTVLDIDGDGLIEVEDLAQLNAIRWDLNGDGDPDNASNDGSYNTAFFTGAAGSTCASCTGYELTADLDFDTDGDGSTHASGTGDSGDGYYNSGSGWEPIGEGSGPGQSPALYTGDFNGNGYTISNLFISRSTEHHTGFFGATSGTVHNVGLHNVYVSGANNTGALVGQLRGGTIRNVFSTGSVSGASNVGGLFGLVGPDSNHDTAISAAWTSATVSGSNYVGGLIGIHRQDSSITASYATGSVTSTGDDQTHRGGLVAQMRNNATVVASYSIGTVMPTGGSNRGGLVGSYGTGSAGESQTSDSYWDTTTTSIADDSNSVSPEGRTTDQLRTPTGYNGIYANWDVDVDGDSTNDSPWHFGTDSQYPALRVDFDGDGTVSDVLELGPQRAPGAPTGLAAALGSDGTNTTLVITWDLPTTSGTSRPTGYEYRYSSDNEANWGPTSPGTGDNAGWMATTTKTFTIPHTLETEYEIEVRGTNSHSGSPSAAVTLTNVLPADLPQPIDYDKDDDGLIEITNLNQLNAIRYDLDGDGTPASGSETDYDAAFTNATTGMGCPATGCTGYELFNLQPQYPSGTDHYATARDLDFRIPTDYEVEANQRAWTTGSGWEPIGDATTPFTATFYGNGYAIRNLFINRGSTDNVGLFGSIGAGGVVDHFALKDVTVTGQNNVGGLAGQNSGDVRFSYVTGSVEGDDNVGGAVGDNRSGATIRIVWTSIDVTGASNAGGVVGSNAGRVLASYAIGAVAASGSNAGGLVGSNSNTGTITISYSTGAVAASGGNAGGLVGSNANTNAFTGCKPNMAEDACIDPAVEAASYWDTEASGLSVGVGSDDTDGNEVINGSETATTGVTGQTTSALKAPITPTGIYATWTDFDIYGDDFFADSIYEFSPSHQYPRLAANFYGDGLGSYDLDFGPQHLGPVSGLSARVSGSGSSRVLTVSFDHQPRYRKAADQPDMPDPVCTGAGAVVCYEYATFTSGFDTDPNFEDVPATSVAGSGDRVSFSVTPFPNPLDGVEILVRPKPVLGVMGRTAALPPFSEPDAPTGVTRTITTTGLTVTWTAPTNTGGLPISGYSVQYRQGNSGPWASATHTGTGTTATIPDLTNPASYSVQVAATNPVGTGGYAGLAPSEQVRSAVSGGDNAPSFPQGTTISNYEFTVGTSVGTITLPAATGGDGTLTYSLSPALPAGLTFDASNLQLTGTPTTAQTATDYTYTATDDDGTPEATDDDTVSITFSITVNAASQGGNGQQPQENRAPTANAGSDRTVNTGASVTLSGSGSDADSDSLTYRWSQTSGTTVTLSSTTARRPTFTAPSNPVTLVFRLVVNDGTVDSAADTVTIRVSRPQTGVGQPPAQNGDQQRPTQNGAPIANAGFDQTVSAGATVTLLGSGSRDPGGDPLTWSWAQDSGPSVTLSQTTAANPTFTAPTGPATLVFSLVVRAGGDNSRVDTVTITVRGGSGGGRDDDGDDDEGTVQQTCPANWPGQGYAGVLQRSDYGRIAYERFFTDEDGQRWFIIRSSDSNGYTTIRAYQATADDELTSFVFDTDRLCQFRVRGPRDTEDRAATE